MKQVRPERYIVDYTDHDGGTVYELVNKYRLLMGLTWREFTFTCIAFYIRQENPEIANAIAQYVTTLPKPGRPKGKSVDAELRRMGVNPASVKAVRDMEQYDYSDELRERQAVDLDDRIAESHPERITE